MDNALTAGLAAYATLSSLYCVLFVGVDQAEDNLAACGYLFGFQMLLAGLGLVFLSLFQLLGI